MPMRRSCATILMKALVFLAPLSLAAQNEKPKIIGILGDCPPDTDCGTNVPDELAQNFTLRWRVKLHKTYEVFLVMEMEGKTFEVPMAPDFVHGLSFPFNLHIFPDGPTLYGIISNGGSGGVFTNYFSRDDDGAFHYLGLFPGLLYNKESGYLVGGTKVSPGEQLIYHYKLKDNVLVLEKTENTLEWEDGR